MQQRDPLIRTKLRPPFVRPGLVSRPRLQEQIAQGLRGPLTLVVAPAGFGKTTLLASSVTGCGMPVAWLSLDRDDSRVGRFLAYLVAALRAADPVVGSEANQLLASSEQLPPEVILSSLINDLEATSGEMALVLDDYHTVSSQAVHEAVTFLLLHCPRTFHLVLATRSDPPLPLARMRASGQMVELRAADLSFREPEAAQFLNDVMGLHLDARSVAVLEARTEGWVAGLQMAALSLGGQEDVSEFVEGFSGTHRYILDYLLEEVLASQSPEIQRFLLYTSILERLTPPLCDAIVADEEPSARPGDGPSPRSESPFAGRSATLLAYLERANLFLVPLDDDRTWYRYHHLFRDLLRTRLDQLHPRLSPRLHLHAAAWLEHAGMMVEAINHALEADAYDYAACLVEENTTGLLAQGELHTLMSWIESLPNAARLSRPWLCVHQAYALAFAGRLAEMPPLLAQAEAILGAAPCGVVNTAGEENETTIRSPKDTVSLSAGEARSLVGAIAALRAMAAVMTGQDAEAISLAREARALLPGHSLWDRATAAWVLGYASHSQGCLSEARSAFEEQVQLGRAMRNIWTLVTGLTDLAWVLRDQGKLHQARALLEEALAEAGRKGARNLGFVARTEAWLASALYEQNEVRAAHRLLSDALTHARYWSNPNHLALIHALLARVLLAEGDLEGAWMSIGEAEQIGQHATLTCLNKRRVATDLVKVWLALQVAGARPASADQ
jgi:LuxR family transcriptional regulator, maltose regulon positive regulatory protein